jgi:hypothetical protein
LQRIKTKLPVPEDHGLKHRVLTTRQYLVRLTMHDAGRRNASVDRESVVFQREPLTSVLLPAYEFEYLPTHFREGVNATILGTRYAMRVSSDPLPMMERLGK